ncbi:MAG: hypothetical protein HUJ31_09830, partial [Pseudomonadales bacterium]|nr:hypothetical protein [Pseudomonadales bacterium]
MSTLASPDYLPADRSEVTDAWVMNLLAAHPTFRSDTITAVRLEHFGDGIDQLSTLVRADLTCASGADHQLVIKLHTNVPGMHEIGLRYGHYESEINFYRHLADKVPVRTPELYAVEMDRDAERVLIVMESFTDWHSPDQLAGASLEEVTIATDAL